MPNNSSVLDRNKFFHMPRLAEGGLTAYSQRMDFKDQAARLAEEAKQRDQRVFEDIAAQFDADHRPVVIAHAAFAYLHAAIVQLTSALIAKQYPATCGAGGGQIIIELLPRRMVFRLGYQEKSIEVTFFDQVSGYMAFSFWDPPNVTGANELYAAGRGAALEAGRFLTGMEQPLY